MAFASAFPFSGCGFFANGDVYVNAYQKSDQTPVVAFSFDSESETFTAHVTP